MGNLFSKRKGNSLDEDGIDPDPKDSKDKSDSPRTPPSSPKYSPLNEQGKNDSFAKDVSKVAGETDKAIFTFIKYLLILAFLGLFFYWVYLTIKIYNVNTYSDPTDATLDLSESVTIFHSIIILFFLYFILITRNTSEKKIKI